MGSSLDVNPSSANIALTSQGSNWLWALFSVFAASAILLLFIAHRRPAGRRAFHYLGVAVLVVTALSYYYMASNLSWTPVPVEFVRSGTRGARQLLRGAPYPPTRAISYGRYIQWFITWPLILLMLHLATGYALSRIFIDLFLCCCAVVCFLTGALIRTRYKWGPFSFGCAFLLYIWWSLLHPGRKSAFRLGDDYGRAYIRSASFLVLIWLVYPVIWGVSEGGNVITVTSECIGYGILDLLMTVCFVFFFLYNNEGLDYDRFEFASGKYSDSAQGAHGTDAQGAGHPHGHHAGQYHGAASASPSDAAAGPATGMAPGSTNATAGGTGGTGGGVRAVPGGEGVGVEGEFQTGTA